MLDTAVPAAFQDVEEADEIGVDIGVRILQRVAHAGLGRQVHDRPGSPSRTGAAIAVRSARSSRSKRKSRAARRRARRASFSAGS